MKAGDRIKVINPESSLRNYEGVVIALHFEHGASILLDKDDQFFQNPVTMYFNKEEVEVIE